MIKGQTSTGFKFSLPENVMDNMELVDALAETTDNNPLAISKVMSMILGPDLKKKLYDHVRTEDGRVPTQAVTNELLEIFAAFGDEGKN